MGKRRAEPGDAVRVAECLVDGAQFLKFFRSTGEVIRRVSAEGIALAHHDEEGLGSDRVEEIPTVESGGRGGNEVLFGIVGGAGWIEIRTGEILRDGAGDDGGGEAVIDCGEQHCGGAAARLSGGTDTFGIDQGMGRQIVETANRIPSLQAGAGDAFEEHLTARETMLFIRADAAEGGLVARIVSAFALTHGFNCEHEITELGQVLAATLVGWVALSIQGVAHLVEYARIGGAGQCGDVEIGGDVEVGLAFVDYTLEAIAGPFEGADRAGVERSALWNAANQLPECFRYPALALANRGGRGEICDGTIAGLIGGRGQVAEVVWEAARVVAIHDGGRERLGLGDHRKEGCCRAQGQNFATILHGDFHAPVGWRSAVVPQRPVCGTNILHQLPIRLSEVSIEDRSSR